MNNVALKIWQKISDLEVVHYINNNIKHHVWFKIQDNIPDILPRINSWGSYGQSYEKS